MTRLLVALGSGLVVALLLLTGPGAFSTGSTLRSPGPIAVAGTYGATPALGPAVVGAAVSSLEDGAGPAVGLSGNCSVVAEGQARCGVVAPRLTGPLAASPPTAVPRWYDVAGNISTHSNGAIPAVQFSGLMAYDPLLADVVLFDGCSRSVCPDSQTWLYNGSSWRNITGTLSGFPPARQGSGMDYDPLLGGVVLFAGENPSDYALSDTWLFTSSGWSNITPTVGIPVDSGGAKVTWAWGAMAWDPALHGIVAVDGCKIGDCRNISTVWDQTWLLGAGGWTYFGPGPGTVANATHLEWSALAYDAVDGYLVSFGGFNYHLNAGSNETYTLGASGPWVNITRRDAGCVGLSCYTPTARISEAMTWDAQLGAVLMTDGYNRSTGTWLNDSWTFHAGVWFPTTLRSPRAPSGYCPVAQPAMPKVSDNIAPFVIGGFNGIFGNLCYSNEWVFENPPGAALTAAPNPIDLGTGTTLNASWVVGNGTGIEVGWTVSFGDGTSSSMRAGAGHNTSTPFAVSFPHVYVASLLFSASVLESDFFYVPATSPLVTVTVYPALTAAITASATSIAPGASVTFTTSPSGGSGGYTYAWAFGDGATSTTQDPPPHTFATAATYTVNLTVTDSIGHSVKHALLITVKVAGFNWGTTETILVAATVIAVVAILAVLLLWRRRRKGSHAPAPPSASASSAPDSFP